MQLKVAIVLLADTETYESMGRMANALSAAEEFQAAGDEVRIIFDGAGVKWPVALSDSNHMYHKKFQNVRERVSGVCEYCANAFKVKDQIEEAGFPFAREHDGHPSFRGLLAEGFQIITF